MRRTYYVISSVVWPATLPVVSFFCLPICPCAGVDLMFVSRLGCKMQQKQEREVIACWSIC